MKTGKSRKVPRFSSAEGEADFWEGHSAADYRLYPGDVSEVLVELGARQQEKRSVTFRLEPELMNRLKKLARRAGIKYQTFVREWLWRAVA